MLIGYSDWHSSPGLRLLYIARLLFKCSDGGPRFMGAEVVIDSAAALSKVAISNSAIEFYCKGVGCESLRFPTGGPLFYRIDSKGSRFSNLTSIT